MPPEISNPICRKLGRATDEAGHWGKPLDGHGLPYFDELTVAYRTIPSSNADPATWRDSKTFCEHRCFSASGADLALLLLWAFIAGFSERLVPDMLTRLAKKGEEKV